MQKETKSPQELIVSLRVEQGAIILPEGMKGSELKRCNRAFKLPILKRKKRRNRYADEREQVHNRIHQAVLMDKLNAGQLKLIGVRPRN